MNNLRACHHLGTSSQPDSTAQEHDGLSEFVKKLLVKKLFVAICVFILLDQEKLKV